MSNQAWASYWSDDDGRGCVPDSDGMSRRRLWQAFAHKLKKGARLLDIASGTGAVLLEICRVRKDLKLVGVDSSPWLPPARGNFTLKPGVAMEKLPFPPDRFDAVTSQFGFEYGEQAATASEIARVLKDGGLYQFLIHTRDGPILEHNFGRRQALHWAVSRSGNFEKAANLIQTRDLVRLPTPEGFKAAITEATLAFPKQSVAAEIMAAIRQILIDERAQPPSVALERLAKIRTKALHEIARLDALDKAALDAKGLQSLVDRLASSGLVSDPISDLRDEDWGRPVGWIVQGQRKSKAA